MGGGLFKKLPLIIIVLLISVVGISYAYWMQSQVQGDFNNLRSKCFKVELMSESDGITLEKVHPVSDEEGKKQDGYTFTIKNTCDTIAYYQVNLEEKETLENEKLDSQYIKVSLNENQGRVIPSYEEVEPTIDGYDSSYKLTIGSLKPEEEKKYTLKLWMDYDTPAIEEVMNATYESKISIIASYLEEEKLENTIKIDVTEPEEYSKESETVTIKGNSENYNIVEYSFDNNTYEKVDEENQNVTIENTYTTESTYQVYFKDEIGNIEEKEFTTNMLDQTPPEIKVGMNEVANGKEIDTRGSTDSKSGIGEYYYQEGNNEDWIQGSARQIYETLGDDTVIKVKVIDNVGNESVEELKEYKEEILNGAIPELGKGKLIPIEISDTELPTELEGVYTNSSNTYGGKVRRADLSKEWYSYDKKKWANAVILKDESQDYQIREEIPESNIESYFVWIPRYRYQLKNNESIFNSYTEVKQITEPIGDNSSIPNLGADNPFEITFENKNTSRVEGKNKGDYLSHPAFDSFESNGMWVGKFETGTTIIGDFNVRNADAIQIKPNVYSWRNIQPAFAFYTSYDYIRELESHMMKNMEWGAIFYLTQSKYGLCTGSTCTEPRINNNGNFVTGYSANFNPTCGYTASNEDCNKFESIGVNTDGTYGFSYYNSSSQIASTTGNYYGIYDMVGSAREYVMGVLQISITEKIPTSGRSPKYNSGFKGKYTCGGCDDTTELENTNGYNWPESKYYDLYDYDTNNNTYQRGHLGDATKELGSFYSVIYAPGGKNQIRYVSSYFADYADFIFFGHPWFERGGRYDAGSDTGLGFFGRQAGMAGWDFTFRIVLSL